MRIKIMLSVVMTAMMVASASARGGARGTVTFEGTPPESQKIRMDAVPYCLQQHSGGFSLQPVQVGSNKGLANVFVYVKNGLGGKKFSPPNESKVILDQQGCWYAPRILGIMVGQKLIVKNSDDTMHNVNAQPYFNIPTDARTQEEKVFTKPVIMQRLRCNIHSWMSGFIGVVDNPYYAVTSAAGTFEMPDIPPRTYTFAAWHEKLGEQTREVTIGPDGTKIEFTYGSISKQKSK